MTLRRPRPSLGSFEAGRDRLRDLGRRSNEVLVVAATVGVATGLVVAGFEEAAGAGLLELVLSQPLWVHVAAPMAGLVLCILILKAANTTPSTADEYIRAFHQRGGLAPLRHVPVRLAASLATLGGGAPLGYEGPALYAGAGIGTAIGRRLRRFAGTDPKVVLVAGAAAGVAAIFKAPVTGLVFALEVPFQDDLARRMVLPAGIASAASYVTFAAIVGTQPILPVAGQPPFDLVDLGGAAVVGVACGCLARLFVAVIARAKHLAATRPLWQRAVGGSLLLGTTVLLAEAVGSSELALGPGYSTLDWALDPQHSLWLIVAVGTIRVAGTAAAIGGGGAGGLFIPLVIQGALIGRVVGGVLHIDAPTLLPVVGMAAFLGAGYRVPLAAVVFVAEFTGRPGFVIPGLIAAVVAQLAMGRTSISAYQEVARVGHLERRLQLSATQVMETEPNAVEPSATVHDVFWQQVVGRRQHTVIVADAGCFVGMLTTSDLELVTPRGLAGHGGRDPPHEGRPHRVAHELRRRGSLRARARRHRPHPDL